jgi:hypothetical protein
MWTKERALALTIFFLATTASVPTDAMLSKSGTGLGPSAIHESLSDELSRRQKDDGLTLISLLQSRVYTVDFANRSLNLVPGALTNLGFRYGTVSHDGTQAAFDSCEKPATTSSGDSAACGKDFGLAISMLDGSALRSFPKITWPSSICWSADGSKMALSGGPVDGLEAVSLQTGQSEAIDDRHAFVMPQCWSADGSFVVYTSNKAMNRNVVTYNLSTKLKTKIAPGGYANWIPGSDWISFLDCGLELHHCTYYKIHPNGSAKTVLFRTLSAVTALSWSDDGQYAAYVSGGRTSEPAIIQWRLRVRRMSDNTEVWVSNLSETDTIFFQWVSNKQVFLGPNRSKPGTE